MKIRAKIIDGEYKDQTLEIRFGKRTHDTKVLINQHPVENCKKIIITLDADRGINIAELEFISMPEVETDEQVLEN